MVFGQIRDRRHAFLQIGELILDLRCLVGDWLEERELAISALDFVGEVGFLFCELPPIDPDADHRDGVDDEEDEPDVQRR